MTAYIIYETNPYPTIVHKTPVIPKNFPNMNIKRIYIGIFIRFIYDSTLLFPLAAIT